MLSATVLCPELSSSGPDDTNWGGILANININVPLAKNARKGGWNDPCLLLAEDWQGHLRITQLQTRA